MGIFIQVELFVEQKKKPCPLKEEHFSTKEEYSQFLEEKYKKISQPLTKKTITKDNIDDYCYSEDFENFAGDTKEERWDSWKAIENAYDGNADEMVNNDVVVNLDFKRIDNERIDEMYYDKKYRDAFEIEERVMSSFVDEEDGSNSPGTPDCLSEILEDNMSYEEFENYNNPYPVKNIHY